MKWIRLALLVCVAACFLAACGAGPKAITQGTLRDTIFSVEPRANNSVSLWVTHDDVGVYCTMDSALTLKALNIIKSPNAEVIITYRSVNNNDPEFAWLGDMTGAGCATEGEHNQVYKLLTIEQVGGAE